MIALEICWYRTVLNADQVDCWLWWGGYIWTYLLLHNAHMPCIPVDLRRQEVAGSLG